MNESLSHGSSPEESKNEASVEQLISVERAVIGLNYSLSDIVKDEGVSEEKTKQLIRGLAGTLKRLKPELLKQAGGYLEISAPHELPQESKAQKFGEALAQLEKRGIHNIVLSFELTGKMEETNGSILYPALTFQLSRSGREDPNIYSVLLYWDATNYIVQDLPPESQELMRQLIEKATIMANQDVNRQTEEYLNEEKI